MSLIGHSLGSVITWDLVSLMSDSSSSASSPSSSKPWLPENPTISSSLALPTTCANVFLAGSPVPLFLTLRGAEEDMGAAPDFSLSATKSLFNVFHPSDPVAYRLEPLLTTKEKVPDAAYVPAAEDFFANSSDGVRFHLQTKKTAETVTKEVTKVAQNISKNMMNMSKTAFSFMDTVSKNLGGSDGAKGGEGEGEGADAAEGGNRSRVESEASEASEVADESFALGGGESGASRVDFQLQVRKEKKRKEKKRNRREEKRGEEKRREEPSQFSIL